MKNEEYIDINKIAELKGLKSNRSLRLAIQKGKYIAREVKVFGGKSYEILYSSLEPEIQEILQDELIKEATQSNCTALFPLNSTTKYPTFISESAKLTALARLDIVKALQNMRTKYKTKKEADSIFLDLYNSGMYLPKIHKFIGSISIGTLAYDIFSIKYDIKKRIKQRMLFHISDWCYLGLKEDLEEFFNVPLVKEPDFSRYFELQSKPADDIHTTRLWKMSPEQYFTSVNAVKVFKDLKFNNYLDVTEDNIIISEEFIINNFRVFSQKEWGISTLKEEYKTIKMSVHSPFIYYSKVEQLKDYKKYCDNTAEILELDFLQKLYDTKYYESLRKHFLQLIFCKPTKKFTELISTISYLFKFVFSLIKEQEWKKQ